MPPPPAGHAAADEHRGGSCALDELAGGGELEGEASPSESMGGPPDMGVYDYGLWIMLLLKRYRYIMGFYWSTAEKNHVTSTQRSE